jgi:serine/threonine-protein phosphatase 2A activator
VNESIKNQTISSVRSSNPNLPWPFQRLNRLLDELWNWVDEHPPLNDEQSQRAQRFGNLAFRQWQGKLLDEDLAGLIEQTLFTDRPSGQSAAQPPVAEYAQWPFVRQELAAYFGQAFGNRARIDYGTGHELNFIAFLCCLDRIGYLANDNGSGYNYYQLIGLIIFPRYVICNEHLNTLVILGICLL